MARFTKLKFALALTLSVASPLGASAETLTLGSISDNIKKHFARFEPLAKYLEVELANDGITDVKIKVLPNSDQMIKAMTKGDVDLFFDSPLVAQAVAEQSEGRPFIRRWKNGVSTYHSEIIVPNDSDIKTIEDLVGQRIGFQEPDSTSGFLLPVALLRRAELDVEKLPSRDSKPSKNKIGYVFTKDDKNTVSWLHRGWINAAATDPQSFAKLDAALPGQFRIIASSVEVPRQVVVRRKDLSPDLQARLTDIMSNMHLSENGRTVLANFNNTDRFDNFPDGVDATFKPISEILAELRALNLY